MKKRLCLLAVLAAVGSIYAQQAPASATIAAPEPVIAAPKLQAVEEAPVVAAVVTQDDLKMKVLEYFNELGKDPGTKYDAIIITISRFKQTENTEIDDTSMKLSGNSFYATEVTSGKIVKETITMRSGVIGTKKINKIDAGTRVITPIMKKEKVGTSFYTATTSKK